jgi:pyruvate dehydrogenase E2 component (dihydrolipoamide acetyltransferase)
MAVEVFLPRLTHDMRSGVLVGWLKADGDPVQAGELLYEVETDKAVTEVAAEGSGVLRRLDYKEGDEIPIGTVIAYILAEGEVVVPTGEPKEAIGEVFSPAQRVVEPEELHPSSFIPDLSARRGIVATPIARRIAREKGVDLGRLAGTGPLGRIVEADVRAYLSRAGMPEQVGPQQDKEAPAEVPERPESSPDSGSVRVPLTRAQLVTGQKMSLSNQSIPQFVLEVDVDMSEAGRLRQETFFSYTAILVKVVAEALERHPRVNASLDGEAIRYHREINVGLATATPDGLLVPVIGKANTLRLRQIQDAIAEIREQAGRGKIGSDYLSQGTFTLSNLGMYGIDRFEALVNPPEAAILAAGRIRDLPWAVAGEIHVRPILTLRLSADHRVLDGASAAPFLVEVKNLLENPYGLI